VTDWPPVESRLAALVRLRAAVVAPTLLVVFAACQSLGDGAKETFSQANSCPLDRVEARERPDLKTPSARAPDPPADIAADPARLRMWQEQQADRAARSDTGHHFVEARGCGKSVLYDCRPPTNHDRPQRPWFCSEQTTAPDGMLKW
jgi:hypothetical protein